jgi:hypothetical protein
MKKTNNLQVNLEDSYFKQFITYDKVKDFSLVELVFIINNTKYYMVKS